jgi:hypothetical protein
MPINHEFKSPSVDISKTFGFQITAFPPVKPKYESLEQRFDGANLMFFEDRQGTYHLEKLSPPLEAKVTLSPNLWDERTKKCEITFTYTDLDLKYNTRKKVVEFGEDISCLINWKHKIVWFTEEGNVVEWKNGDEK